MPDGSELPRVALNAALLSPTGDYRSAGIHQHIVGLAGALAERDDVDLHVLASAKQLPEALRIGTWLHSIPSFTSRPAPRILWEQLALPLSLLRKPVDLVHCPAYAVPLGSPVPAVVTIHDLSFFRMPEVMPGNRATYLRWATRLSAIRSAAIIAVSDFTRTEIVDILRVDESKVFVVPNGVDPSFKPCDGAEEAARESVVDLPGEYIFSLGTIEPRKNLGVLLSAYAELRRRDQSAPALVIAGAPGWGRSDLHDSIRALGLDQFVTVTGHVDQGVLPLLYAGATLFAFPSRYEGFGLPVLESMACGTPVISSDASSMPEVIGDAGIMLDPDDVREWANGIELLLDDGARRQELAQRGLERAEGFSWDRAAELTRAVYRRVIRRAAPGAAASSLPKPPAAPDQALTATPSER